MQHVRLCNLVAWFVLIVGLAPAGLQAQEQPRLGSPPPALHAAASTVDLDWRAAPPLPEPAGDGALFGLYGSLFYAGGWTGNPAAASDALAQAPLFDGVPAFWESAGRLPGGRFGAGVAVAANRAYLLGGASAGATVDRTDSFDGSAWRSERPLPEGLRWPAVLARGQRIYVAGGYSAAGAASAATWSAALTAEGALGPWRSEAPLPTALITRLAAYDDCLFAIGGKDAAGQRHAEIYRAVLAGDQLTAWTPTTPLPQPLALHDVAVRDGVLYVLGGEQADGSYSSQVYVATIAADCALGPWTAAALPNHQGRRRLNAVAVDTGLYLVGGQISPSQYSAETWYALPLPPSTLTPTASPTPTETRVATPTATPTATPLPGMKAVLRSDSNGMVRPGDEITYYIDYEATGNDILANVVITNAIPSGVVLVPGSILPDDISSVTRGVITWSIGNLGSITGVTRGTVSYRVRVPTPTPTPTATVTLTRTPTPTTTATHTNTPNPTATHTVTSTPTITPPIIHTPTNSPTASRTPTRASTPTLTPTNTPTVTRTATHTRQPTVTRTRTSTATTLPTITPTPTVTRTPTVTPTSTPTSTRTSTSTVTLTSTPSATPTFSSDIAITAVSPVPPSCVLRYAADARERTLTIIGRNIQAVYHLQFQNMLTGEQTIHFNMEVDWNSLTNVSLDFGRILGHIWGTSKLPLKVRITSLTYAPLSSWSPEFLLADDASACSATPTVTPTPTPTVTPTATATPTVTRTPTPTATDTACYKLSTAVAPAGSGTIAVSPSMGDCPGDPAKYRAGAVVSLQARPATNFAFKIWFGADNNAVNPTTVTMTADKTVTANFLGCVAITATTEGSLAATASVDTPPNCPGGGGKYEPGSYVTLRTSSTNPSDVFQSWTVTSGALSNPTDATTVLTVGTLDAVATAIYGACKALTISASPPGGGTITQNPTPNCSGRYLPGTSVQLTANPSNGYYFANWTGDATGISNPITVIMNVNKSVTAAFLASVPAAPSNLRATVLSSTQMLLEWNDNSDNETYFVIYDGSIYVSTVGANVTSYVVSGLAPNSYHCFHLYAGTPTGSSAWTDWACNTTWPAIAKTTEDEAPPTSQDAAPGEAAMWDAPQASSLPVLFIINRGAYIYWQRNGQRYQIQTNMIAPPGGHAYLPTILRMK